MKKQMIRLTMIGLFALAGLTLAELPAGPNPGPKMKKDRAARQEAMRQRMKAAWGAVDKDACFKALDNDGDGVVTQEEFERADLQEVFGARVREAMRKNMGKNRKDMFKRADKNGDGMIAADEFPGGPERFEKILRKVDKDGDGLISQEEWQAAAAKRRGKGGRGRGKKNRNQGGDAQ